MLIAFLGVDYMIFTVNGNNWILQYVRPNSEELCRSDGVYTLGVTDNTTKTVTIADNLSDRMTDKVLCHELTHVYSFENGCHMDMHTEEIVADFLSLYGRDIVYMADDLMKIFPRKVAY